MVLSKMARPGASMFPTTSKDVKARLMKKLTQQKNVKNGLDEPDKQESIVDTPSS